MPAAASASFKDLCLDAVDVDVLGPFWAAVLQRDWHPSQGPGDGARVTGPTPRHLVWINEVTEPHTVKGRVHLDVWARTIDELTALGARELDEQPVGSLWTILADPEGNEFCAFLRENPPAERNHGLVVDCADPVPIAGWWARVYGADVEHHDQGHSTVHNVPGMPILTMDFVPVPETKTVKNRVHWDVTGVTADLVAAGATLLRARDEEIFWDVLADPDGNEFCAFRP